MWGQCDGLDASRASALHLWRSEDKPGDARVAEDDFLDQRGGLTERGRHLVCFDDREVFDADFDGVASDGVGLGFMV